MCDTGTLAGIGERVARVETKLEVYERLLYAVLLTSGGSLLAALVGVFR